MARTLVPELISHDFDCSHVADIVIGRTSTYDLCHHVISVAPPRQYLNLRAVLNASFAESHGRGM